MTYDRSAIMRHANRLAASGMPRAEAMKAAWQAAKAAPLSTYPKQQPDGLRASLKRYGFEPVKIGMTVEQIINRALTIISTGRTMLPPPNANAIDLKRGTDGVYRI